jgi:hypothetical protein
MRRRDEDGDGDEGDLDAEPAPSPAKRTSKGRKSGKSSKRTAQLELLDREEDR